MSFIDRASLFRTNSAIKMKKIRKKRGNSEGQFSTTGSESLSLQLPSFLVIQLMKLLIYRAFLPVFLLVTITNAKCTMISIQWLQNFLFPFRKQPQQRRIEKSSDGRTSRGEGGGEGGEEDEEGEGGAARGQPGSSTTTAHYDHRYRRRRCQAVALRLSSREQRHSCCHAQTEVSVVAPCVFGDF